MKKGDLYREGNPAYALKTAKNRLPFKKEKPVGIDSVVRN